LTQTPMADADTSIPFWTSIAQTFGTNATPISGINFNGVIFELFNEPFLNSASGTLVSANGGANVYTALINGGTLTQIPYANTYQGSSFNSGTITSTWNIAGYQQLTNAVRATGANNLILIGSNGFTSDFSQWANVIITDPVNNFAAAWHPYTNGTYPYAGNTFYPHAVVGSGTVAVMNAAQAVLTAGYPIVITEDGGNSGPAANVGEPHITFMTNWADQYGVSYLGWEFKNIVSNTTNGSFSGGSTEQYCIIGWHIMDYQLLILIV